jgi:uncharacterized phage-like protein YoqJ
MKNEVKIWLTGDKPTELLRLEGQNKSVAYSARMNEILDRIAAREIERAQRENPNKNLILLTGLELGMEQAAARAALTSGIEVQAYLPYREHGNNWNAESKRHYENLKNRILENGGSLIYTSGEAEYHQTRVALRNYQLAEDANQVLTLHASDKKPIHASALVHAAKRKVLIENIYDSYKTEFEKLTTARAQPEFNKQNSPDSFQQQSNPPINIGLKREISQDLEKSALTNRKTNESLEITMPEINKQELTNPRTARAVAAILGQTTEDALLARLNQTDGRNQSEQASFLGEHSSFARDIYERGGTIHDGVLIVPKENSSLPPQMEIATEHHAVGELKQILGDEAKAKELAPQLVEAALKIAGKSADGKARLATFQWIYGVLKNEQNLLGHQTQEEWEQSLTKSTTSAAIDQSANLPAKISEALPESFINRWEQIKELSEQIASLEPNDFDSPVSLEEIEQNKSVERDGFDRDENSLVADIIEQAVAENEPEKSAEQQEIVGHGLTAFERVPVENNLPEIPENLYSADFLKLLEKLPEIDRGLEHGASEREVLRPFSKYVENTRLDNELRQIEQEYARQQNQRLAEKGEPEKDYRFVATREEVKELAEERKILAALENQQIRFEKSIKLDFSLEVDREKVERSIQNVTAAEKEKIELSDEESLLRETIIKERDIGREIRERTESIAVKENLYQSFNHLAGQSIPAVRRQELIDAATAVELPVVSLMREKHADLSAAERLSAARQANTIVVKNPSEYLFVREIAEKQFEQNRSRALKKEYDALEKSAFGEKTNDLRAELKQLESDSNNQTLDVERKKTLEIELQKTRLEATAQQQKINDLKSVQPSFAYQIEGSQKIIKSEPSARAVAGYEFAKEYVRYQLVQPESRLRHESARYREYAARLEKAATLEDVVKESYEIRRDNHDNAKAWKTAETTEERARLVKPLSKRELALLFTEQSPKHFTGEMALAKLNFAHYAEAKAQMTKNLLAGKQEPSAAANKLVESLAERLNRRFDKTKLNATKHFFESLKTPHENLVIKNKDFDHRAAYQLLPPHEKDFVYQSAERQKANLEYRLAYFESRAKSPVSTENDKAREKTAVNRDFATGALWFQAETLGANLKISGKQAGLSDDTAKTINVLLHNQTKAKNLQITEWLEQQNSPELKKVGEILRVFAAAEQRRDNDKIVVTVKLLPEMPFTEAKGYQSLLEQFYPADYDRHRDFKIPKNESFRLENSRRAGQTKMLAYWANEAANAVYRPDAPVSVFANETQLINEIEKIKATQIECRRAAEMKNQIVAKYEEQLKSELEKDGAKSKFSPEDVQKSVFRALSPTESAILTAEQQKLFERAQAKIMISDFENFNLNERTVKDGLSRISESFEQIAALERLNAPHRLALNDDRIALSIKEQYQKIQSTTEARTFTAAVRQLFKENSGENSQSITIREQLEPEKQAEIWSDSHQAARIAVEPEELSREDLPKVIEEKALALADAIEQTYRLSVERRDEGETGAAFETAEQNKIALENDKAKIKSENFIPAPKPATLIIFEREIQRAERLIFSRQINEMLENGQISLADLDNKKIKEHFTSEQRNAVKQAAIEKASEKLEPKELVARARQIPENLQRQALATNEALAAAAQIYSEKGNVREIYLAFQKLDAETVKLRSEREDQQTIDKYFTAKNNLKNDLATMFKSLSDANSENAITAMTTGLTQAAFEKQGLEPQAIGISKEKINQISTAISVGAVENKHFLATKQIAANTQQRDSTAPARIGIEQNFQQPAKMLTKSR